MPTKFRIPKLTDREIISALGRIRTELKPQRQFVLLATVPHKGDIDLREEPPENNEAVQFAVRMESQVMTAFRLRDPNKKSALLVRRHPEEVTDSVEVPDEWPQHADEALRSILPELHASLLALARRELRVSEYEAALRGDGDSEWNRYRNAQTEVLNSLESAAQTLIVKTADRNTELDRQRAERFEKLEASLRAELQKERERLQKEIEQQRALLGAEEKGLADRLAAFETKEAHYVARQKQGEQLDQVQKWLVKWDLTTGTTAKRRPIATAYIVAIIGTGWLAFYSVHHSYALLQTAADLSKLMWWQWVALMGKAFFPLATCVTFIIYFIRWSSSWARQHADEEFRNRALLIDIGRSGWLIEAVRDAQQRSAEIPQALLTELSRNLFSYSASPDADVHPHAISDVLLQGLTSRS